MVKLLGRLVSSCWTAQHQLDKKENSLSFAVGPWSSEVVGPGEAERATIGKQCVVVGMVGDGWLGRGADNCGS